MLQVVKADYLVYAVPIEQLILGFDGLDQAAVEVFLEENIEKSLEQFYKRELICVDYGYFTSVSSICLSSWE